MLGKVWSAGQVLEGIVGFDGVADPDIAHVVWSILSVPRPKGVVLSPLHWQGGSRPSAKDLLSHPVTLILQYKRPDYMYGNRAAQWNLWNQPYFRFRRTSRQHSILMRLEKNLGGHALVRYASPAFWKRQDLEIHACAGSVIQTTGFVSPMAIGKHKVWTYDTPGNKGKANPNGRRMAFESMDELRQSIDMIGQEQSELYGGEEPITTDLIAEKYAPQGLYRQPHIRNDIKRFAENLLRAKIPLSNRAIKSIVGLAAFNTLLASINTSWYLIGRGLKNSGSE